MGPEGAREFAMWPVKEGAGCVPGKKYPDGGRVREKWDNLCPPQEKAVPRGGASLAPMIP